MFQVRIHGRGGQGVVTAAELLAVAVFDEKRHAQAFPSFGSERLFELPVSEEPAKEQKPQAKESVSGDTASQPSSINKEV